MSPDELWQREYDRWLAERARANARQAWRLANEPGYRERVQAWGRTWRAAHREQVNVSKREWARRYRDTQHRCVCGECGRKMRRQAT